MCDCYETKSKKRTIANVLSNVHDARGNSKRVVITCDSASFETMDTYYDKLELRKEATKRYMRSGEIIRSEPNGYYGDQKFWDSE